ncbi:MAG: hypothetical protein M3Q27_10080 [Actinomycetota bacterium]|nr:hypothetical protein [Actinomycetota bacterium]
MVHRASTSACGCSNTPLAIYPIGPYDHEAAIGHAMREADGERRPDDAPIYLYGYCAEFCADNEVPTQGATVEDHGPWCFSTYIGVADALTVAGARAGFFACLARSYQHGLYRAEDVSRRGQRETYVSVSKDDGDGVFFTPGEARRFAAQLVAAADQADGLHHDLRLARARRERGQ